MREAALTEERFIQGECATLRRAYGNRRAIGGDERAAVGEARCARTIIGLAKLLAGTQAVIVFLEMLPDEIGLNGRSRLPSQRGAGRPEIAAVGLFAGGFVVGVAVALGPFAGDAQVELVADEGDVDHAFETAVLVVADV